MPVSLLRADNNLPPWRAGLKEVNFFIPLIMQYVSPVIVISALTLFVYRQFKFSDVNVFYNTCFYGISLKVLILKRKKSTRFAFDSYF